MSEAYLMSMPIIMNCLGGEMIYILCSRLKAQNISIDKSIKVIKDIGHILYNKKFQNDLYIHKKPYKHQEVKIIFENFAHSSIMRLNTSSMNKLFELMLMTLKLQILRTRYPEEIFQITINHFLGVIDILNYIEVDGDKLLINMVQEEMNIFKSVYSKLSPYDFIILKSTILRFLQGKNVKVSIFIQDNLQDNNSTIYLPMNEESPPFVGKLGIVHDYVQKKDIYYELKLKDCFKENKNDNRMDNFKTELGKNIFSSIKLRLIGRIKAITNEKEEVTNNTISNIIQKEEEKELTEEQKNLISQGTKMDLITFTSAFTENKDNNDEIFEFDLFGMNNQDKNYNNKEDENFINISISNDKAKNKILKEFDNLNISKKGEEDEDDLLDLMDKIS